MDSKPHRARQDKPSAVRALSTRNSTGAVQAEDSASSQDVSCLHLWYHQKTRFSWRMWDKNQNRHDFMAQDP